MSRRLLCLISLAFVLALGGLASAGLVGHWRLDEGAGTVAVDSSGNGHNGELLGNPQWVEGVHGGALQFAGNPDKVDVPYSEQLNPDGEFSASVWASVDAGGSGHRSPITSRDDYPQRGYIIYCEPGNTWQFWTGSAAGGFVGFKPAGGEFGDKFLGGSTPLAHQAHLVFVCYRHNCDCTSIDHNFTAHNGSIYERNLAFINRNMLLFPFGDRKIDPLP